MVNQATVYELDPSSKVFKDLADDIKARKKRKAFIEDAKREERRRMAAQKTADSQEKLERDVELDLKHRPNPRPKKSDNKSKKIGVQDLHQLCDMQLAIAEDVL